MFKHAILTGASAALFASSVGAADVVMSVLDNTGVSIGGTPILDGDLVRYDPVGDSASIIFSEALFGGTSVDLTAAHILPDGDIILSVLFNGRTLGGLTFDDGDLVRYNPGSDTASIYFLSEASFGGPDNPDISAVYVSPDEKITLSTFGNQTLGGLAFGDGDVIEYDPLADTAVLKIAEADLFDDGDGDVDAIHRLSDTQYVLSFATDTELISGTLFTDGDLVLYDTANDSASLYLSESVFTPPADVNAVFIVPEPASVLLLSGALLVIRRR